jgi:hypothetical protein
MVVFVLVAVFLDYGLNYAEWSADESVADMFNIAREGSLGNWYSTTVTAMIGAALWVIYERLKRTPGHGLPLRGWAVLATFFFYLSIDDGIRLHEELAGAIQDFFVGATEEGALPSAPMGPLARLLEANPSYPWLMIFGPVIGALGLYMVWFLWKNLDRASAKRVALGVGMFALAQCQDFVEGLDSSPYDVWTERWDLDPYTLPHYGKVIEETLEMLGMSLILYVFLVFLQRIFTEAHAPRSAAVAALDPGSSVATVDPIASPPPQEP